MSLSILCVDDEPGMAELVGTHLERIDESFVVTAATSAREALGRLEEATFDCIVSAYDMPDMDGLVFLETVRGDRPDFPFILFTGRGSEDVASDAISAGVTDYLRREPGTDQYRELAQRIRSAVDEHRLSREVTSAKERAEAILRASPDAILVGVDGACVYANPAAVELLSPLSKSEILDERLSTLLRSDGRDGEPLGGVQEGRARFERDRITIEAGTHETPVEATARQITWDGRAAAVYILRDLSERPEYDRESSTRQSLLESAFSASPDGILIMDEEWNLITYNERFRDLWAIPEDVLEVGHGKLAMDLLVDAVEDADAFVENVEAQFRNASEPRRTRVQLADGTVVDCRSAPLHAADGTRQGYVWFYRDVTDRRHLHNVRQEAFDRMTDAVYAVNDDWEFTFLNGRAEQLLRRDAEDLLGTSIWEAFPDAVDTDIHERYRTAVETGEPAVFELYYEPLETEFEIRAFPSETGLTVYFRDITDQRRTEAELRTGVDTLHDLYVVASDLDTPFEEKQELLLELGGEYLDLPYGFVTEIDAQTQTVVAATGTHDLLQPGETCPLDESYCRKTISTDSGLLAVRDAGRAGWSDDPAYDAFGLGTYIGGKVVVDGELYGTICFAATDPRDREFSEMERTFVEVLSRWLSYELEQREHRSQLASTNAQLEEFASIVSHDLRNPLSVAEGYVELAIEEDDVGHLSRVEAAHERMRDLIEDVLMLARDGEVVGATTEVSLAALSESCWDHVDTRAATLRVDANGSVVADESRLAQLFENLARNAVEHGGDDVTVTVGDLTDGFFVEDTGVGIPDDIRSKLFDAGYSQNADGTGIGLRIVEQIVTAHGWSVTATEGTDGGARFEITGVERP